MSKRKILSLELHNLPDLPPSFMEKYNQLKADGIDPVIFRYDTGQFSLELPLEIDWSEEMEVFI